MKRRVERSLVLPHAIANVKEFPHGRADDHHLFFSPLGEHERSGRPVNAGNCVQKVAVPGEGIVALNVLVDRILTVPSPERAREAVSEAYVDLKDTADRALEVLERGWEEATAVLALPAKSRRRSRTTNMLERFIEEIHRREKVVRIFPNEEAAHRLIGALCAERHEEWPGAGRRYLTMGWRYLTMDAFFEWKTSLEPDGGSLPVAA